MDRKKSGGSRKGAPAKTVAKSASKRVAKARGSGKAVAGKARKTAGEARKTATKGDKAAAKARKTAAKAHKTAAKGASKPIAGKASKAAKATSRKPVGAKTGQGRHLGKTTGKKRPQSPAPERPATSSEYSLNTPTARGLGAEAAGQSGDTEGLSRIELADSESVEELVEEGQAFEAGIVSGIENVPDADKGGVRTRQTPEDDVPEEYLDKD